MENRDLLIGTQNDSGKLLSHQVIPIAFGETAVILIVAPLVGIMNEQVQRLNYDLGYGSCI